MMDEIYANEIDCRSLKRKRETPLATTDAVVPLSQLMEVAIATNAPRAD